jgi:hypothetical protein
MSPRGVLALVSCFLLGLSALDLLSLAFLDLSFFLERADLLPKSISSPFYKVIIAFL